MEIFTSLKTILLGSVMSQANVILESFITDCTSSQFKCSNGKCIKASYRCNSVVHCTDGSDEIGCSEFCKL